MLQLTLHKDVGCEQGCQESVENESDFAARACRQVHLLNSRQIGFFPQKRSIVPVVFTFRVLSRWYLLQFHSGVAEFDGERNLKTFGRDETFGQRCLVTIVSATTRETLMRF